MAFTTQQNFLANLDGTNAMELNKVMDRELDTYQERLGCIEEVLNNTNYFTEYFDEYFNANASQEDYLSIENNVCRVLENYASYLLNSKDLVEEKTQYKIYHKESNFRKALKREVQPSEWNAEVMEIILAKNSNYKKAKEQKIYAKDMNQDSWLGSVLREYQNYIDILEKSDMTLYRINRLKGGVQRDMIDAKNELNQVHGYNLRYFSESTVPTLDVIDFQDYNQLKGYSVENVPAHHKKVKGLLHFEFNGDFQNDFQCILYDLEKLIEKTPLTDTQKEVLKYYRKGLTSVSISDIIGISSSQVRHNIDGAIKKINKQARELKWR